MKCSALFFGMAMFMLLAMPGYTADVNGDNVYATNKIGIGTVSPVQKLDLYAGVSGTTRFRLENLGGYVDYMTQNGGGGIIASNGRQLIFAKSTGQVGYGTTNPTEEIHYVDSSTDTRMRLQNPGGNVDFANFNGKFGIVAGNQFRLVLDSTGKLAVGYTSSAITPQATLDVNGGAVFANDTTVNGELTMDVANITGGSDLSENFNIRALPGMDNGVQPGMVVCIDPDRPGELMLSSRAYDKTVAGVISGAGGLRPGMMMGQQGTLANGAHPVALTGRVYCMVDAISAPIEPGDLLTTSDTPGHAMKAQSYDLAHGTIIGKAMTGLAEGKGLVMVLVNLQ